jgi:glutamate racemase
MQKDKTEQDLSVQEVSTEHIFNVYEQRKFIIKRSEAALESTIYPGARHEMDLLGSAGCTHIRIILQAAELTKS